MAIIAQVSQAMQTLLTTTTEAAAATLGYVKRPDRAKFTPSTLVQTLVYGWLAQPTATVEQLAQMAGRVGVDVSPQAIDQRFTAATADLLQQVLLASVQQVITADTVALPILQRFTSVRVQDSTSIGLPDDLTSTWRGCGNATGGGSSTLKCGLQLDLLTGAITGLDLVNGRAADRALPLQHTALPAGSLRLADRGFYHLEHLRQLHLDGVFWLTRLPSNALVAYPGHASQPLASFIHALGPTATWDCAIIVGGERQLHARLLATRVAQEVADQRRARIRHQAQLKNRTPSAAALALAGWNVVITNAPRTLISLAEAGVLMRLRWQIELLFKLWKSHAQVDEWRTENPTRILCEIYAKLLGLVFQQWLLAASSWRDPERSLFKAAPLVASMAGEVASALREPAQFLLVLERLATMIRRWARTQKRHNPPTTAQRLQTLTAPAK